MKDYGEKMNNDVAAKLRAAQEMANTTPAMGYSEAGKASTSEQTHRITVTTGFVRKLARLSSEADRKLREQVPEAFVGDIVNLYADPYVRGGVRAVDGQGQTAIEPSTIEPGLYLSNRYMWELVPNKYAGLGPHLVCRERI